MNTNFSRGSYLNCIHWKRWGESHQIADLLMQSMEKAQCLTNGEGVGIFRCICSALIWAFRGKRLLMKGKVGWKLNIQTFEAREAMSGRGSCTPTAASCGEIPHALRTTQVKSFISLFTFISRSVLWAKKDGDRQTERQTNRCCHLCAYGVSLSYADPCQRWRVVSVTPCLCCTTLTVSSHSASSTSTLQYWLTSDDFADTLQ